MPFGPSLLPRSRMKNIHPVNADLHLPVGRLQQIDIRLPEDDEKVALARILDGIFTSDDRCIDLTGLSVVMNTSALSR